MPEDKELILLIEDEPQMRRFLRITLQSQGYRLVEAATAQEGLMQATTRNPDVVLLDLGLPDLDGLEVTKRVARMDTNAHHRHIRAGTGAGQGQGARCRSR